MLAIKRIYDAPSKSDGYRILIDRMWPRGISKSRAALDGWAKEITPSAELRNSPAAKKFVDEIMHLLTRGNVTLLYGARDTKINHAVVLEKYLEKALK